MAAVKWRSQLELICQPFLFEGGGGGGGAGFCDLVGGFTLPVTLLPTRTLLGGGGLDAFLLIYFSQIFSIN